MHIASDQEGDFSQDYARGEVNLFPSQMGMTAVGDEELVYRAYRAVARQQHTVGIRMLHNPCLDVNVEPANPEIRTRSFGDEAETVARMGPLVLRAYRDEGLIATGKHFPGRGDSKVDVHYQADVFPGDREELEAVHLLSCRRLIPEGLPAIMTAHTIYPALDAEEWPASVSRRITTDAIGMKGVVDRFSCCGEAAATAIAAGKKVVVISNAPYPMSIPAEATTVLLTFSTMPRSLEHAAAVIYGKAACGGTWPLKHYPIPTA